MEPNKSAMPPDLKKWSEAKKKHRLSQLHVCMAMELGFNPGKMSGYAPNPHEQWKAPLPDFIERIYEKRFGASHKPVVRSFVQIAEGRKAKKTQQKQAKDQRRAAAASAWADPAPVESFGDSDALQGSFELTAR